MRRWMCVFIVLSSVMVADVSELGAAAEVRTTCDGLPEYRAAMFNVAYRYMEELSADGIPLGPTSTFLGYSKDDFAKLEENTRVFQQDMEAIEPPEWAAPWHSAKVELGGLIAELAATSAEEGLVVAVSELSDEFESNAIAMDAALAEAITACGDFERFEYDWDSLDGTVDGTPVAVPTFVPIATPSS